MPTHSKASYDLFLKRMDALYCTDANGRLVCTNEWEKRTPPRLHLMRTAEGSILRYRTDVPEDIVLRLQELAGKEPPGRAFDKLPAQHDRYLEILADHASVEKLWSGPAYMAVADISPNLAPTVINKANAGLLRERFEDWLPDVPHRQPFVAMIREGQAISICASVRVTAAVHCAGTETHADYRRNGYASDAVAGWARIVRSLGAMPFYSTSWDNFASQRVSGRLGMTLVGVDFHVT